MGQCSHPVQPLDGHLMAQWSGSLVVQDSILQDHLHEHALEMVHLVCGPGSQFLVNVSTANIYHGSSILGKFIFQWLGIYL